VTLEGKKVVVIGASSGIGKATARLAAAGGARVVMASRSRHGLERARAGIEGAVEVITVDISREADVTRFFDRVGALDHLVNAAVLRAPPGTDVPQLDSARAAFETKFWGSFHAIRHAVKRLSEAGSITLLSGMAAYVPSPTNWATAAVTGAVVAFAKALAVDLAPIRVNAVSPGFIETEGVVRADTDAASALAAQAADELPVRRPGHPDDVAQSILYLMCNGFTTGTVLHVDGGKRLIW
jgi:NAD(P)-dependent dehydrogenase (short-subunit alcohol dehydrogenase family)